MKKDYIKTRSNTLYFLGESKLRIRTAWLVLFFARVITFCLGLLPAFNILSTDESTFFTHLLVGTALLYFAYFKHGTKILTLYLFSLLFGLFANLLLSPWSLIRHRELFLNYQEVNAIYIVLACLDILLPLTFYFLSSKLRKINQIIQLHKFVDSEEFKQAMTEFDLIEDLRSLEITFSKLCQKWPKHFTPALFLKYQEVKERLSFLEIN